MIMIIIIIIIIIMIMITGEDAADDSAHAVHPKGIERVVVPRMVLRLRINIIII